MVYGTGVIKFITNGKLIGIMLIKGGNSVHNETIIKENFEMMYAKKTLNGF